MDLVSIGNVPWGEECAQTLDENFEAKAKRECAVFRAQLLRLYQTAHGQECPCKLVVKSNPHDFGTYYEVAARCESPEEFEAAQWLDEHAPERWDEEASLSLRHTL